MPIILLKKIKIISLALIPSLIFSQLVSAQDIPNPEPTKQQKGFLDLSDWQPDQNPIIKIDEETLWAFFLNEFIDPTGQQEATQYLAEDEVWGQDNNLPAQGYASYRLLLRLPGKSKLTDEHYKIKLTPKYLAYDMYINGELVAKNGEIGKTKETSKIAYGYQILNFEPTEDGILNIVFHVSNFEYLETLLASDVVPSVVLAAEDNLLKFRVESVFHRAITSGILIFAFFYHLILVIVKRKKKEAFLLSAFVFVAVLINFVRVDVGFPPLVKVENWRFFIYLWALLYITISGLNILFFREIFPKEYGLIGNIILCLNAVFLVVMFFLPIRLIYTSYLIGVFINAMYILFTIILAIFRRRENSQVLLFGISISILGGFLEDIAKLLQLGNDFLEMIAYVGVYTFVIYVATLIIITANRNAKVEKSLAERTDLLEKATEEINALNTRLAAENLRMGNELETTRKLQELLLPKKEELAGFNHLSISTTMTPAGEVGGDYYDVLSHDENGVDELTSPHEDKNHVTIGIGDITGHGLESGMLMLMTQMGIKTLLEAGIKDVKKILKILNRSLYDNVIRMGAEKSLTLGLLDYQYIPEKTGQGKLYYSGQHETLIVVRANGEVEEYDTMDLGFPIALEKDISQWLGTIELDLNIGDGVVMYTDGITEAINNDNEMYGTSRLVNVLKTSWHKSSEVVKQSVLADFYQFIADREIEDDVTLVIIKQL